MPGKRSFFSSAWEALGRGNLTKHQCPGRGLFLSCLGNAGKRNFIQTLMPGKRFFLYCPGGHGKRLGPNNNSWEEALFSNASVVGGSEKVCRFAGGQPMQYIPGPTIKIFQH